MVGYDKNAERRKPNTPRVGNGRRGAFEMWSSSAPRLSAAFNIEAAKDRPHPEAEVKTRKAKKRRGPSMGGSRFHSGGRKARHPQASTPFSIRLTPAERKRLEEDAAGEALGAYVKKTLFAPTTKAAARRAMIDHHRVLIAQVLAMVGSSGIGDALTSMAVAIKMGTLANEAEVLEALNEAQDELADIRSELLRALDIRKE